MVQRNVFLFALTLLIVCGQTDAQWLRYKTPGIPRTADGKPNLSAPAPRTADGTPDLSGLWQVDSSALEEIGNSLDTIQAQPWAAKQREDNYFRDSMSVLCLPSGPRVDSPLGKVIQTPSLIVLLHDEPELPPGVFGRPRTGSRSQPCVDGLFRRALGRRHIGDREQWLQ